MSFIKLQDNVVLKFDLDTGDVEIYEKNLLPVPLRNILIENTSHFDRKAFLKNYRAITGFFRNRCLSVKRENAKKLLNALNISQGNDDDTVIKIMVLCKGLSVTDDFWITNDASESWKENNLRENPLHEVLAQIALNGESPVTITGKLHTPELTGQGVYAKAWKRENGELFLYKASTNGGIEADVEVECSLILDHTNVPHVKYWLTQIGERNVSVCKNMCDNHKGIVSAEDVFAWCNRQERSFDDFVRCIDGENFFKTVIVDYLIANPDRHGQNWGFYMDNNSGDIIGMHPIFDHNNAFDRAEMADKEGGPSLMMPGKSKLEAAKYARKKCSFMLSPIIPSAIFLNKEHFSCFSQRASMLGLKFRRENNVTRSLKGGR